MTPQRSVSSLGMFITPQNKDIAATSYSSNINASLNGVPLEKRRLKILTGSHLPID